MKRRLCAFLVFALCVSCLAGTAMAADESLHTDYVPITEDGFVADSMDGVDAIYNLTIASPDCLNYVQRYYREVYGLELQATGHDIWLTNSSAYYFAKTSDPQPGDIGYASASEREKGNGHYVMCKSVNEAAGTITLIEQNWIWNGQASVNRTISYNSCYTFYTLTSNDGSRPEASEPSREDRQDDVREAMNGALPSAPLSAAGMTTQSASDVLGNGTIGGEVSDWAKTPVSRAKEWGITAGANMTATSAITRGQFAQLLSNTAYSLGIALDLYQPQKEVALLGLMMGDTNGNFDADGKLTREMAAVVLTRLWQLTGDALPADESVLYRFQDAAQISNWAREGTAIATQAGLIGGTGSGFSPKGDLTVEQAVTLLARLFAARTYSAL